MVQRAQVDQSKQLAQQIADWYAKRLAILGKQHYHAKEPGVFDLAGQQHAQNASVDSIKEFAHVHLQRVRARRRRAQGCLRVICGAVRALANAAGKRLVNKALVEDGVNDAVDGVLHHQVSECRRVDGA